MTGTFRFEADYQETMFFDAWRDGRWQRIAFDDVREGDVLALLGSDERHAGRYLRVTRGLHDGVEGRCFDHEPAEMVPAATQR